MLRLNKVSQLPYMVIARFHSTLTGIMKQYTHPINMGILVFPFLRDFRDPIVINPPLSCKWQQHYDDTWKSWCVLPLPHHASKNLPTYTYGSHLTAGQMTAVLLLSTWVECMWLFDEQWVKVKMTIVCLILRSTSATSTECICYSCDSQQHNIHTLAKTWFTTYLCHWTIAWQLSWK